MENEGLYWLGGVNSLAAVDLSKILITEKSKGHFQATYDREPMGIVIKAPYGIVNRGLRWEKHFLADKSTQWFALGYF